MAIDDLRDRLQREVPDPPSTFSFERLATRVAARRRKRRNASAFGIAVVAIVGATVGRSVAVSSNNHGPARVIAESPSAIGAQGSTESAAAPAPEVLPAPLCATSAVRLTLTWIRVGSDLEGNLRATNGGQTDCFALFRPTVTPLTASGAPIPVDHVEVKSRLFGPSLLAPGASTASQLSWTNLCSTTEVVKFKVEFPHQSGSALVLSDRPVLVPECNDASQAGQLNASLFNPLSGTTAGDLL